MKRHRAGKVLVQRRGTTVSSDGEPSATWTTIDTTSARVRPLAGNEFFAQSGEGSKATTEIRLRYNNRLSAFTPADRLSINGVIYDVEAVVNVDDKNRELIVRCSKVDRDN
jgi:SPP1 family predicted phage head-tail adaptor